MVVFALLACEHSVDENPAPKSNPAPVGIVNGCDPEIRVPGIFGAIDPTPADAHSDTFGAAPTPFQVRINWPSHDPSTSIAFLWRTDVDTLATVVEYGVGSELTERVEGASFRYGGTTTAPGPQRIHEIKLCSGLAPSTTYSYRVGGDGHWSEVASFTTAPARDSDATFRIAVAGDSRGAYETWGALLSAISAQEPDMLLFGGDMIEFGANQAEWDAWFTAAGDLMQRIPFLPAHGNHEFMAPHYFAQWSLPDNEQWYTIRYGSLQLAVLNDTVVDLDSIDTQATWLDEVFGGSDASWRSAIHHQALYSTCTRHGSNESLRALWAPKYDAHDLQVVFNSHNHVYERSVPVRAEQQVAADEGVTYLVTGGAGGDLYPEFVEEWFGAVATPIEHYVIADFGPTEATFVVRDLDGNVIDQFVVPK